MGSSGSKSSGADAGLAKVCDGVRKRVGDLVLTGRYHRLPKRLSDDYAVESKVLGAGYNGQVFLAKSKATDAKFAVKGFKLNGVSSEKKEELEAEAEIFLSLDHPHVCRLVDVYESESELSLVMECMGGGELFDRVTEQKKFSERDAADATWQMLLAINYIHNHGIVHRDLKLENFLYDEKDSKHLKLIDFGFSKIWDTNVKMKLSCGTLAYVAPEVLAKSYTSKCDLWSLGVISFILLAGYMPFSGGQAAQIKAIQEGRYHIKKVVWDKISEQGCGFVRALLEVDATKRLTAEQALQHAWIVNREEMSSDLNVDQGIVDSLAAFAQASQFRRACMSLMAWSLSNDERAQVRQAFIELDLDKTGTIKCGELKTVLQEKFHIDCQQATTIFAALDTNNDHEIHYSDFLAAMVSSRIQMHDSLVEGAFRRFDSDNSGFITGENIKVVLGPSVSQEEVDKMLAEADTTKDGQISLQEFMEYIKSDVNDGHSNAAAMLIDQQIGLEGVSPEVPNMVAKPQVK